MSSIYGLNLERRTLDTISYEVDSSVEVLCYKTEGCRFDSDEVKGIFSIYLSLWHLYYLQVNSFMGLTYLHSDSQSGYPPKC
jgi:hypothetical protein